MYRAPQREATKRPFRGSIQALTLRSSGNLIENREERMLSEQVVLEALRPVMDP